MCFTECLCIFMRVFINGYGCHNYGIIIVAIIVFKSVNQCVGCKTIILIFKTIIIKNSIRLINSFLQNKSSLWNRKILFLLAIFTSLFFAFFMPNGCYVKSARFLYF